MAGRWIECSMVLLAGVLYAVALKYFVLPSKVILTGTEGIAAAISYYFENYLLFVGFYIGFQIVLLAFAVSYVSRIFAFRTFLAVTTITLTLVLLPELRFAKPEPENERIILVLFGGILTGVAKSVAFKNRGSTGDEDVIGAYLAVKYLRPVGHIAVMAGVVSTIFGLTLVMLKTHDFEVVVNTLMYTSIYVFASAETLNNFYRKFKITLLVIITRKQDLVEQAISKVSPHRTFTASQVVGGRTREAYSMLKTIVTQEELPPMVEAIAKADPESFHYHHDINGVPARYAITPIG